MTLRDEAEARLGGNAVENSSIEQLRHELSVHQIELEMQNETLRQTQLQLEKSLERYQSLYEFAPVGYLTLDRAGLIIEANLTAASLLGVERRQLPGRRLSGFIAAGAGDRWHRYFLELHKCSDVQNCELNLRRGDKQELSVQLSGRCSADDTIRLVMSDITALRLSENRLRDSEERFRAIFEGALDGIALMEPETKAIVNVNPAFAKMLGYGYGELSHMYIADIHPREDLPWIVEHIQRHRDGVGEFSSDIPVLRSDGQVFYADIRSSQVHFGGQDYMVGVFRDATLRREAEEVRRTSELKHRLLFECSHDALMTLSPPSWHFTSANEAAQRLLGATCAAEFTRFTPWDFAADKGANGVDSKVRGLELIDVAVQTGSNFFKFWCRRLDGTVFYAEVLLTRFDLGSELFLQATVRDISERRRIEVALRDNQTLLRELAAQGAASLEAELKSIAREVHDELGQVLTAIRMDASLLRMQFGERDPQLREKIQDMLVLVDRAIQGVRDVTVNLRPPVLDVGLIPALNWLCHDFNARSNALCKIHLIDYVNNFSENQIVTVFRIVQESLTNAARHAAAKQVDITLKSCDHGVVIEVKDDGVGFDKLKLPGKKSFGLLGMKERALAVGGRVEIVSAPSQGTVVSVYIPQELPQNEEQ